mgnify:FL=1|tara:strand:- start:914 stop:1312 length:399 start_codon:yes stop_codon:yes gene_type:complete
MPFKLYSSILGRYYENEEEMFKTKKQQDNCSQKRRFWKKNWNFDISYKEYNEFNKYSKFIMKIQKFHKFFCEFDSKNIKSEEELYFYSKHADQFEFVYKNPDAVNYIKSLKKINDDKLKPLTESEEEILESE